MQTPTTQVRLDHPMLVSHLCSERFSRGAPRLGSFRIRLYLGEKWTRVSLFCASISTVVHGASAGVLSACDSRNKQHCIDTQKGSDMP